MREEIAAAVLFLTKLVKKNKNLSRQQIEKFSDHLSARLVDRYKNHWYTDDPLKGQAYRCIRTNERQPYDSLLSEVAREIGVSYKDLNLPTELTLWVDPCEVICRIGEQVGSYYTIASLNCDKNVPALDLDDFLLKENQKHNSIKSKFIQHTTARKLASPVKPSPKIRQTSANHHELSARLKHEKYLQLNFGRPNQYKFYANSNNVGSLSFAYNTYHLPKAQSPQASIQDRFRWTRTSVKA